MNVSQNKYLVLLLDSFFTGDTLIIVDLVSRKVPGFTLKNEPVEAKDVVDLIKSIKEENQIEHAVFFHIDNQSIFASKEMKELTNQFTINFSFADPALCFQETESLNKTIKKLFRKTIAAHLGAEQKPYLRKEGLNRLIKRISWKDVCELFEQVIKSYNESALPGKRVFHSSPNLSHQAPKNYEIHTLQPRAFLPADENSEHDREIAQLKRRVLEQQKQLNQLIRENELLQQKIDELLQSIQEREQREQEQRRLQELERNRKQKRKERILQEPRACVSYKEFLAIKEIALTTFKNQLAQARVLVALTLLYLTGLRISNLLLLTKTQVFELLNQGETEVRLIKNGKARKLNHLLCLGAAGRDLLREIKPFIDILCQLQSDSGGPFFCAPNNTQLPFHRTNFDKQCNKVLQKASALFGKHIRSHSFRATIVTDLLDCGVPLEKARDILGHQSISTTDKYRRIQLSVKDLRRTLATVQRARTTERLLGQGA